jgi:hypothetical protein
MVLAIEESEYVRVPSQVTKAGVKVGIFPFGSPRIVDDDSFDIMPGQSTSIRLTPVNMSGFLLTWTIIDAAAGYYAFLGTWAFPVK